MDTSIGTIQIFSYKNLFISGNFKKVQESVQKGIMAPADIQPKLNLMTCSQFKRDVFQKFRPTLAYITPQTDTVGPSHQISIPATPRNTIFIPITCLQRASVSTPNQHNHLPNKSWLNTTSFLIPKPPQLTGRQRLPLNQVKFILLTQTTPKEIHLNFFHTIGNQKWKRRHKISRETRECTFNEG